MEFDEQKKCFLMLSHGNPCAALCGVCARLPLYQLQAYHRHTTDRVGEGTVQLVEATVLQAMREVGDG